MLRLRRQGRTETGGAGAFAGSSGQSNLICTEASRQRLAPVMHTDAKYFTYGTSE